MASLARGAARLCAARGPGARTRPSAATRSFSVTPPSRPTPATRAFSAAPPSLTKRYALLYDYCDDVLEKRAPHRAGHVGLIREMHAAGEVFAGGAFDNPVDGAIIVFNTQEAAERFLANDPRATASRIATCMSRGGAGAPGRIARRRFVGALGRAAEALVAVASPRSRPWSRRRYATSVVTDAKIREWTTLDF